MVVNVRVSLLGLRMQVNTPFDPKAVNTNFGMSLRQFALARAFGVCRHLRVIKLLCILASPIWHHNLCLVLQQLR